MDDGTKYLKIERLRLGWTLRDASERTRISITALRALESGKTPELGSPLAVEGLISRYSEALGIGNGQNEKSPEDGQKAAGRPGPFVCLLSGVLLGAVLAAVCLGVVFRHSLFPAKPPVGHLLTPPAVKTAPGVPAVSKAKPLKTPLHHPETLKAENKPPAAANHAVAPAVPAVLSQSLLPVSVKPPAASTPVQTANKPPPVSAGQPAPAAAAQPAAPESGKTLEKSPSLHSLEITADKQAWVEAILDGGKTESRLLQPGQTMRWKAEKKVYLIIGNGGGVHIKWDGNPVEISKKPGSVVRLRLSGNCSKAPVSR